MRLWTVKLVMPSLKIMCLRRATAVVFLLVSFAGTHARATEPISSIEWIRQEGTRNQDDGIDVAVDAIGDVFLLSNRQLSIFSPGFDFFVTKYDYHHSLADRKSC